MAEGEEYYHEEVEVAEDDGKVTVVDRMMCKHHANLTVRQYYVAFGTLSPFKFVF